MTTPPDEKPEEIIREATARMERGRSIDDLPEPEEPMQKILHAALRAAVAEGERHGLGRDDLRMLLFGDVPPDIDMKYRTGLELVGPVGSPAEALDWAIGHLSLFAEHNGIAFMVVDLEDGEAAGPEQNGEKG